MSPVRQVVVWAHFRLPAVLALLALLTASEQPAQAYTDPGSGLLIWQTLIAALVGASFYVRRFVTWIKRRKKISNADET
jgi:hypothetical protein